MISFFENIQKEETIGVPTLAIIWNNLTIKQLGLLEVYPSMKTISGQALNHINQDTMKPI